MRLNVSEKSLPVYEAMASPVRLKILQLISEQPRCITELADSLNLSKAIITRHIQKLEDAHLIKYVQLATDDKRKKVKSKFVCKLLLGTCSARGCPASLS